MSIDEEDITVGKFLYFVKNNKEPKNFVGIITKVTKVFKDEDGYIDGYIVEISFPLCPGKIQTRTVGALRKDIEDGFILIK